MLEASFLPHRLEAASFAFLAFDCVVAATRARSFSTRVLPQAAVDPEELRQHRPVLLPGALTQPGNLGQHRVLIAQAAAAP